MSVETTRVSPTVHGRATSHTKHSSPDRAGLPQPGQREISTTTSSMTRPKNELGQDGKTRGQELPSSFDKALWEACIQIEGVFLGEMFKQMKIFPSMGGSGSFGQVWGQFSTELFGQEFARQGGIGLARVVYNDICRQADDARRPADDAYRR